LRDRVHGVVVLCRARRRGRRPSVGFAATVRDSSETGVVHIIRARTPSYHHRASPRRHTRALGDRCRDARARARGGRRASRSR
jgi:hypothetical protein